MLQTNTGVKSEINLAGQQIGHGRGRPAIRNVGGKGARLCFHHLGRQMGRGAATGCAKTQFAGVGFQVGQELLDVVGRNFGRIDLQKHQDPGGGGNRHDVFDGVKRHLGVNVRVDRYRAA